MSTVLNESTTPHRHVPGAPIAPDDGGGSRFPFLVRHPQDPHRRTAGRGRRAVRHRRPLPERGKTLLDISHPAFKAVTAVRGKVIALLEVDEPAVSRSRASG